MSAAHDIGQDQTDVRLLNLVHRTGQCLEDVFKSHLIDTGLTPRQHTVLEALRDHPNVSQTRLVNLTGIDRSTMADIIRRLSQKKLIQRRRSSRDARSYQVQISELGITRLDAAQAAVDKLHATISSILGPQGTDELAEQLAVLVSGFSEKSEH